MVSGMMELPFPTVDVGPGLHGATELPDMLWDRHPKHFLASRQYQGSPACSTKIIQSELQNLSYSVSSDSIGANSFIGLFVNGKKKSKQL